MADMFNILKVTVGDSKLTARVLVNPGAPLYTSEDIEATARVYYLVPAIAQHTCLGDAGSKFQDCMADTEVAHLLEHVTVEIMNQTGLAGDIVSGRTFSVENDERLFDIELSCPDDVLTIGALSSATFMLQWAFMRSDQTPPDFDGTVDALTAMVKSLRGEASGDEDEGGEHDDGDEGYAGPIDTEGAVAVESGDSRGAVYGGAAAS